MNVCMSYVSLEILNLANDFYVYDDTIGFVSYSYRLELSAWW